MRRLVVWGADDAQSTEEVREVSPTAAPSEPIKRLLRWLPAIVTIIATIAVFLARETAPFDIARYGLYVAWGLILPGTLVYRALRRVPHSLVDDLTMGTALGFVLELVAWAIYAAAGLQSYLWTWPALVVVLFGAVPRLRGHWRRPDGYRSASMGWCWAVAGIAVAVVGYLGATPYAAVPIPRDEAHWYHLDGPYLLSLVTEAMHHFPPHNPQVASEPLNYHWFAYAHMASSSLISGVEAPIVYYRFALPLICIASVVLTAVVGWRVSGRPWVGTLAAALMFVVAEFTATDFSMFGPIGRWVIATSPSVCYAWLSTFPLIMICVDRIRSTGLPEAPLGRGGWVLLALFATAASGAKATILFVLLAGLALAGLVELIRHRFPRNLAITSVVILIVIASSIVVLFGGEAGGMKLSPLQILEIYIPEYPRSTVKQLAVLGFIGGAYVVYVLARLVGIPVLVWLSLRRRGGDRGDGSEWSVTEWFLLGAVVAGIAGTHILWHATWAQIYLLRSAWPFGVILSALGLAALVERHRVPRKVVAGVVVGGLVLAAAIVEFMQKTGLAVPGNGSRIVLPIYWAAFAVMAVAAVIGVAWLLLGRSTSWRRGGGALLILVLILLMGLPISLRETYLHATADPAESGTFYAEKVTPDGIAMTDWLKAHVSPDELLATNGHCPAGGLNPNGPCLHLTFWLSAYSERRVLVAGWGYVARSVARSSNVPTWPGNVPFFDPQKLAVNDAAFYQPTPAILAELRDRYGVAWLAVDRTVAWESPMLRQFATLRFERGAYAVYELR